jgi:ribulose-phosphate 3-epimerase
MTAMHPVRIAPSLLASDFARLGEQIHMVEAAGADWLHVDVMDGHFVPNLTIGPPVVAAIKEVATRPLDVHLMIEDPWRYADDFLDAGAAVLTFHLEVAHRGDASALIARIQERGALAGMALNPDADVGGLEPFLSQVDMILVMSVFPGFGGQQFMPDVLSKVRAMRSALGFAGLIEMDGGIGPATIESCASAGTDVFVAGTAVFAAEDVPGRIKELRELASAARPALQ